MPWYGWLLVIVVLHWWLLCLLRGVARCEARAPASCPEDPPLFWVASEESTPPDEPPEEALEAFLARMEAVFADIERRQAAEARHGA